MTEGSIRYYFNKYGQYATGKDYALLNAIEAIVVQQRKPWVALTDAELESAYWEYMQTGTQNGFENVVKILQAKLKEKNYDTTTI